MNPLSVVLVGGDWDEDGGRASSYIVKLYEALMKTSVGSVNLYNGGQYSELQYLLEQGELNKFDAILWFANVPNDLPKARGIKDYYPRSLLVTSKRNEAEYSFQELVNRALSIKANLVVEFCHRAGRVWGRIFDPLGAVWQDFTDEINILAVGLVRRLAQLKLFTRQTSIQASPVAMAVHHDQEFFSLIRDYAEVFHMLIAPAPGVTRFLGNSSFRCQRGFPSLRDDEGHIFVSRRNIDKRFIEPGSFVAVEMREDAVYYRGEYKPSVDTPIQVRLYQTLPRINYMVHGHVYVQGAPYTSRAVPCGALEEAQEIAALLPDHNTDFAAVNLLGHGCIVMAHEVSQLKGIKFIARPIPESL